ncbi:MAG: FkbM family methyltransferase [Boseongicola sp.]|nr:FkbM family methyltransferase [Boseongicola sp.]NNJ67944.1 FkbM family methyltransferase [Boseongicola sp.]
MKHLKLLIYGILRFLPGKVGAHFETKFLWAQRKLRVGAVTSKFDEALEALEPNGICLDLGANVGTISQRLWDKGAQVYAFEPDPWAFEQLRSRFEGCERIVIRNAAVGNKDGTATLKRDPGFSKGHEAMTQGSSLHQSLLWQDGQSDTFQVETVDILTILRELPGPVQIMKMDIEGAEADVLERLLPSSEVNMVRKMFVETHEPQMPELRDRLKAIRSEVAKREKPEIYLDWV